MIKKTIKGMYYKPGEKLKEITFDYDLKAMQSLVGGYIEQVRLHKDIVAICDEEWHLKHDFSEQIPTLIFETFYPRPVLFTRLYGPVLFAATEGEELRSLTTDEMAWVHMHVKCVEGKGEI